MGNFQIHILIWRPAYIAVDKIGLPGIFEQI